MEQMRIFLSGTYLDLIEYRQAVIEQVRLMERDGVTMEYFAGEERAPLPLSLDKLEECNVYLGIIGHRYGTLVPGRGKSITHLEYERALDLAGKERMRILIFLAADSVGVPADLINDADKAKQREFRQVLRRNHTPTEFTSPEVLASKVAAGLYKLRETRPLPKMEVRIFDEADWKSVQEEFDNAADAHLQKVRDFMRFLADRFETLFELDHGRLDVHPFFKAIREQLKSTIPAISLNDEEGILKRTGVRHVIFRTQTAQLLMQPLNETQLRDIGKQIGKGAAQDLIRHTLMRLRFIPASAQVLVKLWDYWDRTGGWGTLRLVDVPQSDSTSEARHRAEWRIKITQNFLYVSGNDRQKSLEETHRLCNFWCGYIHGFLDTALPGITKQMHKLDPDQRLKVTLPAYHRVHDVKHEKDENLTEDVFLVTFEEAPGSAVYEALNESQRHLNEGKLFISMTFAHNALYKAKQRGAEAFNTLELTDELRRLVEHILDGPPVLRDATKEAARKWFEAANQVIGKLFPMEKE